jgi:WD40 repeat protein
VDSKDIWIFATFDFFIEVWKVDPLAPKVQMTLLKTFKAHEGKITDFCLIRISNYLASSSMDGLVRIWNLEDF